jgi:nucleotide-binding universal stress UspA family protein
MGWNPKTIVVGVDGSEVGKAAAEVAVEMARHWGAKLVVATVIRPPEGWWGIGGQPPTPEALAEAITKGQEDVLAALEDHLDLEGVDYEMTGELGDPTNMLLEVCDDREADLLVIGRRGAGLAERVLMGSVADRLTHHSKIPVMIIP